MTKHSSPLFHLLTGAGIDFIALVISAVIGFFLMPFSIRILGDRDYGLLLLVGSFTGWFGLMDLGLSSAVSRYVSVNFAKCDFDGCNRVANSAFFLYLIFGFCGITLAIIAALLLPFVLTQERDIALVPLLVVLAGVAFAVDLPLRALAGLINGCMRRDRTSLLHLTGRVIRAAATVAVLLLGGRLLALSLSGVILSSAMAVIWLLVARWTLPHFQLAPGLFSAQQARTLLKFGGIAFAGRMAETLLFKVDGFIIAWFVAVAAVAHYNVAITLATYYHMTMVAFTGWLLNWFAHKTYRTGEDATESLLIATRYAVILGSFCVFALIAWGRPFIERWMGPDYLDAYPCLVALAIATFVRGVQMPNLNMLYALAKHHIFSITTIIEGLLNLVLSLTLVHHFGLTGIAVATMTASLIVNGLIFPLACCRVTGVAVSKYCGTLLHSVAVVAVVIAGPWWLAGFYAAPRYGALILLGTFSALAYFPLAFFLCSSKAERRRLFAACFG